MVRHLLDSYQMSQVELAASMNVTQSAVSQWASGLRTPKGKDSTTIERAIDALDTEARYVDTGWWNQKAVIPVAAWRPVFIPSGRFRLPQRIEWSGTDEARWRSASSTFDLLDAYRLVITEGRAADITAWVDPAMLWAHFDEVLWPRGFREPWAEALSGWKLG
ncbi:MAG: helix-turn-helix domain-containing protein [Acidimicrobiales bacterium]|jgi:transcriptional regulator with XRE-family HTH domain